MILPFLVECNYNCLLCEPPLHLGGQSLCAGHLILGLPVRPAPCTGEGEAGLRAGHNIRVRRIDKEILDPIIRSSPGSVTAQTPGLGDSQLSVARPGPGTTEVAVLHPLLSTNQMLVFRPWTNQRPVLRLAQVAVLNPLLSKQRRVSKQPSICLPAETRARNNIKKSSSIVLRSLSLTLM